MHAYAIIRASRAELDVAVRLACGLPVARGRAVQLLAAICTGMSHRSSFRL